MKHPLILAFLALTVPTFVLAEDPDPPSRVARLSVVSGHVAFQAADERSPEKAILNRPVTSGDRLITESASRAELTMGIAAIRLDERTDLKIPALDDGIVRLRVEAGTIGIHLRELEGGETFEIDLPDSTARLLEPGHYRVDVGMDGTAVLAVRDGEAEVDDADEPVIVSDGEEARLATHDRTVRIDRMGQRDDFDDWADERERQLDDAESSRYVSRDVVGYEDLDRYGSWDYEPEYGRVWAPRHVSYGWAPYRFGRWVWVRPWGWTWVDRSPWGFAPFHYGRWAYVKHRWCWVPGPRHHRAVFAPALVAWSDGHSRHGYHSRDRKPRKWAPLAPRDKYVPRHRASSRYVRHINEVEASPEPRLRPAHATRREDMARSAKVIRERFNREETRRSVTRDVARPKEPIRTHRARSVERAAAMPPRPNASNRSRRVERRSDETRPQRSDQASRRSESNRRDHAGRDRGGRAR